MASLQSPPRSESPENTGPDLQDVPYSETFTDELMRTVLNPPAPSGKSVLLNNSTVTPNEDQVRLEDAQAPVIDQTELPLPLDDPRRVYSTEIPGVRLTHPGGSFEGGTPLIAPSGAMNAGGQVPEDVREYAKSLIQENNLRTPLQLKKFIGAETNRQLQDLRKQMNDRNEALEKNEQNHKQMAADAQAREIERRIEERKKKDKAMRRDS